MPASTSEQVCVERLLDDLVESGQAERLELVLVDRGTSKTAARRLSKRFGVEVRPVGWDEPRLDEQGRRVFRPIRHAWRVEVAHGRLDWSRRLAKSFENTTPSADGCSSPASPPRSTLPPEPGCDHPPRWRRTTRADKGRSIRA